MTSQQNNNVKNENKITVMVVIICILFIVLTTPLTAFYVIVYNAGLFVYMGPELQLYRGVIFILALSNHAINFLLYAVTSSKFREELRSMCGGNKVSCNKSESEDKKTFRCPRKYRLHKSYLKNMHCQCPKTNKAQNGTQKTKQQARYTVCKMFPLSTFFK